MGGVNEEVHAALCILKNMVTVQSQPRKHFVFPQCGVSAK